MAELGDEIIVVIVLGSALVILGLILTLATLLLMRKKRVLCFKHRSARPFLFQELGGRRHGRGKRSSKQPFGQKKRSQAKKKSNKNKYYQSLSKALKFPNWDPFAGHSLDNPMINTEDLDMDWTNPAFDEEGARKHDAVITIQSYFRMIRVRIPYIQLREATILAQALFRGRQARAMLPKVRKEKAQRDQLRKKQVGWKKKGTLAALKYYNVKAFGFAEVEQLYGMDTVRDAAYQLKNLYGGKGKMKLKLFISIKGIKLYHVQTLEHFATVNVSTVSFCTLDPKNRKVFAFINRKKRRNFCHVFQANENDAQKMVETMAEAFDVTFRKLEQQKKQKEREMEEAARKASFHHSSQMLEDEVASMLEMAETASRSSGIFERPSQISLEGDNSLQGSRERLLSSPDRRARPAPRSSLVTSSFRASPQPVHTSAEEEDIISVSRDKDKQRPFVKSEWRRVNRTLDDNPTERIE